MPAERLFGFWKGHFRNILLSKMLQFPSYNSEPLKESLKEVLDKFDV